LCCTTEIFAVSINIFSAIVLFVSSRKLHGKISRTDQESDSNENEDNISIKSLDTAMEPRKSITTSNNRERRAYLKSLERSLRTGRPIQDDDNNYHPEDDSHSTPLKFIRHCIDKHIRRKTSDTFEPTEI
jgi:hypothetical protein